MTQSCKWPRAVRSLAPACVTACVYLLFLAAIASRYGFNPSAFIGLGSADSLNAPARLPGGLIVFEGDGYDGQHFYHIASDLIRHDRSTVDPMRYQRIGYPLVAAAASFGRLDWLPASMLAVNLLAVAVGTWVCALLLSSLGASPWWSLFFGLNPGQILGVQMDLALPLQMCLAVGALLFWQKRRVILAAVVLSAAFLTSESSVLFVLPLVAAEGLARRWRAGVILGSSVLPYLIYQAVLSQVQGRSGVVASAQNLSVPFAGMVQALMQPAAGLSGAFAALARQGAVVFVMVFMLAALAASAWKMRKGYDAYTGGVAAHAGAAFLGGYSIWEAYASAGRVFSGVFVFLVLSYALRPERSTALLLAGCAVLALFTLLRPFVITPPARFFLTP